MNSGLHLDRSGFVSQDGITDLFALLSTVVEFAVLPLISPVKVESGCSNLLWVGINVG